MSSLNEYTKKLNEWSKSLNDMQKYSVLAIILGLILLALAIILW